LLLLTTHHVRFSSMPFPPIFHDFFILFFHLHILLNILHFSLFSCLLFPFLLCLLFTNCVVMFSIYLMLDLVQFCATSCLGAIPNHLVLLWSFVLSPLCHSTLFAYVIRVIQIYIQIVFVSFVISLCVLQIIIMYLHHAWPIICSFGVFLLLLNTFITCLQLCCKLSRFIFTKFYLDYWFF